MCVIHSVWFTEDPEPSNIGGSTYSQDSPILLILFNQQKVPTFSGKRNEDVTAFMEPFETLLDQGVVESIVVRKLMAQLRQPALELVKIEATNYPGILTMSTIKTVLADLFSQSTALKSFDEIFRIVDNGPKSGEDILSFIANTFSIAVSSGLTSEMALEALWKRLVFRDGRPASKPGSLRDLVKVIEDYSCVYKCLNAASSTTYGGETQTSNPSRSPFEKSRFGNNRRKRNNIKCFRCNKLGYVSRDCYVKLSPK